MATCRLNKALGIREGIEQKIRGALIANSRVRLEMTSAAIQAKVEPTGLIFLCILYCLQSEMIWVVGMVPGELPAHLLLCFPIVKK